jgi:phosphate transport system substrate-binding protein
MKHKSILLLACLGTLVACGNNGDSITVITREDGSGTKSAFMEILGLKGKKDIENVVVQTGTAAVMTEVKNNKNAIAYDSLGYVTDEVKKLNVDGVAPTIANIKSGAYSISRPLNVVYKEETIKNSSLFSAYLDFLKSKDAQTIISDEGYVSILDGAVDYVKDESLNGTIRISGSTSLQPLMIVLAEKFKAYQSNVTIDVSGGGSGTGYSNASNGTSDFGMISAEFDSSKAPSCVSYTVAKDGIAVIVNKANALDSISKEDLKNIYNCDLSGEQHITKWSQLSIK